MKFIKKSVVLKEVEKGYSINEKPISGIARLELESGVLDFYLTLVGILPSISGEYFVGILNDKNSFFLYDLEKKPFSFHKAIEPFNIYNGFAVGLIIIENDIPLTIAFAKDINFTCSLSDFKKAVADKCLLNRKAKQKESEKEITKPAISEPKPLSPPPIEQEEPTTQEHFQDSDFEKNALYNDEAVATENYYDFTDIETKLNLIKEQNFDKAQFENELPFNKSEEKTKQSTIFTDCLKNETNASFSEQSKKDQPYYLQVREELNAILNKFPPEENLNKLFHDGKFVKVNYSNDKFYVVGLIKEENKEKYLCYGVPATYSPNPPKELAGYCTFIPLSIFDLSGDGYWIMFQDAITGKCINATPVE